MKILSSNNKFKASATLLGVLILSSGLSCAVAPATGSEPAAKPAAVKKPAASGTVSSAFSQFTKRDYAAASSGYDAVASSTGSSPGAKQLAYLGKALVHLSTDSKWRSLDEAGRLLQSAEAIDADGTNVETQMLMNALSSLIGVEANISEMDAKVANSASEIARLKEEKSSLQEDQAALNEALEKLKALTLGN